MQQLAKKSPSAQHHTTLLGYIFATKARIDNRKKRVKAPISPPHVLIIWWTNGLLAAEIDPVVWGTPANFQRVSRLGNVTARHSSSGRRPNFAALNRGRRLYSAGRPSRWALAHISSFLHQLITRTDKLPHRTAWTVEHKRTSTSITIYNTRISC